MMINVACLIAFLISLAVYIQRGRFSDDLKDVNVGIMSLILIASLLLLMEDGDALNVLLAFLATVFAFLARYSKK